jgi:hypothetical protein
VELPENLIELARQKYEELINGYWKNWVCELEGWV